MANIMQRAGYSEFTAKDYLNRYIQLQANAIEAEQGGYAQGVEWEHRLREDSEKWEKTVDKYSKGEKFDNALQVMHTPLV